MYSFLSYYCMAIEKIKKIKPLKRVDLGKVRKEVSGLERAIRTSNFETSARPHVVNIDSERYVACDAKHLNKYSNQSGRGDYRYLFQDGQYAGIAVHGSYNGYRKVA